MSHKPTKRALRHARINRAPKPACVCLLWPRIDPDCPCHGDLAAAGDYREDPQP